MLPQPLRDDLLAAGDDTPIRSLAARVCLAQPNISRPHAYLMIVGDVFRQGDEATKTTIGHAAANFATALDPCRLTAGSPTQSGGLVSLGEALGLFETDEALTA